MTNFVPKGFWSENGSMNLPKWQKSDFFCKNICAYEKNVVSLRQICVKSYVMH